MLSLDEFQHRTAYKCTYEEYAACYCPECDKKDDCKHSGAFRRMPVVDGGLGLCPNLSSLRGGNR